MTVQNQISQIEDLTLPESESQVQTPLERLATQLSSDYILRESTLGKQVLQDLLTTYETSLTEAYQAFSQSAPEEAPLSYAAEWLLDNFFVIQQAIRQIREDMPSGYYQQLPKLGNTAWSGSPRIYALAQEIIVYSHAQLDMEQTSFFLRVFQRQTSLTMGEIWAFPTMLRLGILSQLTHAFVELRRPDQSVDPSTGTAHLDSSLVQSCITSLRRLAIQNWKTFFENVSLVEQIFRDDPADIYMSIDFDTRDCYRKVVEQIARGSDHAEEKIAHRVVSLSRSAAVGSRQAHIGYYLIGDGRTELETLFQYRAPRGLALRRWMVSNPTAVYLVSIGLLTCLLLGIAIHYEITFGASGLQILGVAALILLPITAIVIEFVNWMVISALPPRLLPRLDFQEGVSHECMTMIVIPALLVHEDDVNSLIEQLEQHSLRNSDPAFFFALLTDYADAPQQHMPDDQRLLERVQVGIAALNAKYPQEPALFYVFHRGRQWNAAEESWMGWERKRGKLVEFNHLLRGDTTTSYLHTGDLSILPHIRYVITLDTDTILPEGGAARLVAALAHPLNRAEYDPVAGKVVAGYSILQPRVEIKPESVNQSRFTQIFAGDVGLDLYTHAVSDVYQDLFGVGSYVGKGIYDVDILEQCLANRIPENALLSHDLFEGIHARVALVTDVFLLEDYPVSYLAHMRRLHRWIRGDWQLLPWLLPRIPTGESGKTLPNTFSPVDRWKMFDNLRRSLIAPALLALMLAAWFGLLRAPLFWTITALAVLIFPLSLSLLGGLASRTRTETIKDVFQSRRMDALRWLLAVAFLPYESLLNLNAIGVTLIRLFITRKGLLQWTTAAQTARLFNGARGAQAVWRDMLPIPIFAGLLTIILLLVNAPVLLFALPILALWFASPQIAYWISLPRRPRADTALSPDQNVALHHLARQTWLFFEQVVGPEDHWLPPDHFQDAPRMTAHRTSPTNIGLLLTSTVAAYDLGYIGQLELNTRLQATFETISKLEHYRGHLLNWYDTLTLASLPPRYVSTVDSGNLAGCLLVVKQACLELPDALAVRPQRWQGLLDTFNLLEESLETLYKQQTDPSIENLRTYMASLRQTIQVILETPDQWAALIIWLTDEAWSTLSSLIIAVLEANLSSLSPDMLNSLRVTSERFHHHLMLIQRDMHLLMPWLDSIDQPPPLLTQKDLDAEISAAWQALLAAVPAAPRLRDIPVHCDELEARIQVLEGLLQVGKAFPTLIQAAQVWCARLRGNLDATRVQVQDLLNSYHDLAAQAEASFQAMDFSFLFNAQRKVFHIGYNLTSDRLDDNFYDLLASEARLASLLAIAKRDVPPSHWLHLSRPVTQVGSLQTLLSWSGTMFEYLMPNLFMESYSQTFLAQSCEAAVESQIAYGHEKHVPWGISESSYYAFDNSMTYQYHAFGAPDLGLKRGLTDDLVIAPYASLLALNIRPQAVRQNMDHLDAIHMRGLYGFYESVDYTPSRVPLRQDYAVVRSYMAHHQGMILVSLVNYLRQNTMIERLHADPRVKSFALLLQEKIPAQAPIEDPHPYEAAMHPVAQAQVSVDPWPIPNETVVPQVHVLSNGRYSLMITNAGSGYSQWQNLGLTRWEPDTTLDTTGSWIYVQDLDAGHLWSAGYQPTGVMPEHQQVTFHAHQAEFQRRDADITLNMRVTIAPDDDVEIRHITLINHSRETRHLRLTSYAEVLLGTQGERHPAFSKLFVQSEYVAQSNLLLFHRRPRASDEAPIYLGHLLIPPVGMAATGAYEGDRLQFVGRGQTSRTPVALQKEGGLTQTIGITLDPIFSLGQDIELPPYGRAQVSYLTLVAPSRQKLVALAERYRSGSMIDQIFEMSRRQNEVALRQLELSTGQLAMFQQLLSLLLYPHAGLRAAADVVNANTRGQSTLWAYAISGDFPILLLRVGDVSELPLVAELLQAHTYWRNQQLMIDLVILNLRDSSYSRELQTQLQRLITRSNSSQWLNQRGGVFVINADQMSHDSQILLQTTARVILEGARGDLASQLPSLTNQRTSLPLFMPPFTKSETFQPMSPLIRPADLQFDNSYGGFSADGKEYAITLEAGQSTPAPWVNVIANEHFGFLVSEAGASYTWSENSSENRLTPWRNDPVSDPAGEALYLRDEETGLIWSPTPYPARDTDPYLIKHGAGYSLFEHNSQGLRQQTLLFAAMDASVKVIKLTVENTWDRPRRITVTYYAEWVLGVNRNASQPYIISEYDHASSALLARNAYNTEFSERVAFLAANKPLHGLTADRQEFLGRMGDMRSPAALKRIGLASTVEPKLDPCAAIQLHIDLPVGGREEVFFLLGEGANREDAQRLIRTYQDPAEVNRALQAVHAFWDKTLGTVQVNTPDPAMNIMLNRWLLYQALVCRIWGRTGFYQSSGAFGFRDQLQDVMALLLSRPVIARQHILEAAHHQFEEGDVLHWWHPPLGRGVRTRFSDDLLWLPFVTAHYIETTGDSSILDEPMPFLRGAPLKHGEEERYGQYDISPEQGTLYEHCLRAIKRGSTAGVHGLPLMGTGDWNDGMNRVGMHGRGESVWVGWFLHSVLTKFMPLCEQRDDAEQARVYRQQADRLKIALETEAWDGAWYRRAYYDNGTPLGSAQNLECQIDAIAQSWAVLSGVGDPERGVQAMSAVADKLFRPDDQIVLLFTPPFDKTPNDPGYVKGYPPGIRENGGQYTHAAIWTVWAFAQLGQGNRAGELFKMLNPISHSATPDDARRYRVEPYTIAADVYSVAPYNGRGGWSWYTGAAGWFYRLGIEAILGLKRQGDSLIINPCIPDDWPTCELTYYMGEAVYRIHIDNPHRVNRGVLAITLDDQILEGYAVPLADQGEHEVRVVLGQPQDT